MTSSRGSRPDQHPGRGPRTVVRLNGPADILGVLPHRLGFHPAESLVVVCLDGPRHRDRLVMRLDLLAERHDREVAADVVDRVRAVGASAAVLVCYTELAPAGARRGGLSLVSDGDGSDGEVSDGAGRTDPARLARAGLVLEVARRLAARRVEVVEAILVQGGRWFSYQCRNGGCCAAEGTPLADRPTPAAARYAAESVVLGSSVLPTRDDVRRSFTPPEHAVARAAREQAAGEAGERLLGLLDSVGEGAARDLVLATVHRLVAAWADGDTAVEQEDASLVAVGLHDKRARDEVMTLVLDHEPPLLVAVFSEISRRAADADAAPISTVLAWAAFADGSGALASMAAERALAAEHDYVMARMLLEALAGMVPPSAVLEICRQVRADLDGGGEGAALGSAG